MPVQGYTISEATGIISKAKQAMVGIRVGDYGNMVGETCIPGLTTDDMEKLEAAARLQFERFNDTGVVFEIHGDIRVFCLNYADFLPESSYTSREMALAMHWKPPGTFWCRYHRTSSLDHPKDKTFDTDQMLKGVAFRPSYGLPATDTGTRSPPFEGHMHCGCPIEDVLLEFFLFKTRRARSSNPNFTKIQSMRRTIVPPPIRAFLCEGFRQDTGLKIQDIYDQGYGTEGFQDRLDVLKAMRLLKRVQERETDKVLLYSVAEELRDAEEQQEVMLNQ